MRENNNYETKYSPPEANFKALGCLLSARLSFLEAFVRFGVALQRVHARELFTTLVANMARCLMPLRLHMARQVTFAVGVEIRAQVAPNSASPSLWVAVNFR